MIQLLTEFPSSRLSNFKNLLRAENQIFFYLKYSICSPLDSAAGAAAIIGPLQIFGQTRTKIMTPHKNLCTFTVNLASNFTTVLMAMVIIIIQSSIVTGGKQWRSLLQMSTSRKVAGSISGGHWNFSLT